MPAPPAIARFAEDELARTPHVMDEAMVALLKRLTHPAADLAPDERQRQGELAKSLSPRRHRIVADFCESLSRRARQALADNAPGERSAAAAASAPSPKRLTLVDEVAVAADVEVARAADTIKSVAEHELRELAAFLSTLAGDAIVSSHHLVLHPDHHARALWDAAQLMADDADLRVAFMRAVAPLLASGLRKQWAAACTRLEDAGIEPAAYRTVILHAGARVDATPPALADPTRAETVIRALEVIGSRLAILPDATPADAHGTTEIDVPGPPRPPPAPMDPRRDTLARIFDALKIDSRIGADLRPAIERLRKPALRAAADDATLGVAAHHPLWSLIDRIAWQGRTLPPPPHRERVRTMQVIQGLADQLAREPRTDASRFRWAIDRIDALERNLFERQLVQKRPQIAALQSLEDELTGATGAPRCTDFGQLPTVPANLYDPVHVPAASAAEAWLGELEPGDVARLLIQGRWVLARLQWRSDSGELWLWADCTSDELWPVRRGALCLLFDGGLAASVTPEPVVGDLIQDLGARARQRLPA